MTAGRLLAGQVAVHQPLPFDLCDEAGRLLLRRGFVVESAAQLERLLKAGLYRRAGASNSGESSPVALPTQGQPVRMPVLKRIEALQTVLDALLTQAAPGSFQSRVLRLASDLQACFALDPDAAIASVQMLQHGRYSVRRLMHAAILTELVLSHAGDASEQRLSALAAALTMNIAMLDVQDVLSAQPTPPTEAQRAMVRDHPQAAVRRLQALGVEDERWLATVAQHHETVDGKGYPLGLSGGALGRHAQVLSLVDRYGSMAIGRAYRAPVLPNLVLRQIFLDKQSVDPRLAALLVGAVGMYPPGSLVALASDELAVVVRRSAVASQPLVSCLTDSRGARRARPLRRLTSEPAFAISRLVAAQELGFAPDPAALWDEHFDFPPLPLAA